MSEEKLQKTIRNDAALEGVGLHSGEPVRLVFKGAPAGHGIQFARVDLPEKPRLKVDIQNVIDVEKRPRRTSIGSGRLEIQTIEHLMAALSALEIDNLLIEIDGVELPGLDGSAMGFYEALRKGGVVAQEAPRHFFRVREPISIEENGASLTVLPSDTLRVSYVLSYRHPRAFSQYYEFTLNGANFAAEVAPSRTFVLKNEADILRKQGLGRGASYDNTLVVGDQGVIRNTLRFEDEFARHKILDLLGDLYLLGYPVQGHIIAYRSGHPLNMQLVRKIREQEEKLLQWGVVARERVRDAAMDLDAIKRIIPHRDPFLFVDRILEFEPGKRAVGTFACSPKDDYFRGHFPNRPILPGVLIVEAMAQVGGILVLNTEENLGKYAYFLAIDNVKFRKAVLPGDELILEVEMVRTRAKSGQVRAKGYVKGKLVAEADLMFALVDA